MITSASSLAKDAFDTETGEVFAEAGAELTEEIAAAADGFETRRISVLVQEEADADGGESGALVPVDVEEENGDDGIPDDNPLKRLIGRVLAVNIYDEAGEPFLDEQRAIRLSAPGIRWTASCCVS